MKRTILFFCLLLNSTFILKSNDFPKVGFFAGYNSNEMITDFPSLKGVPNCCPKFTNDNGLGYNFGMYFQYPISNMFNLGLRTMISDWNSQLSAVASDDLFLNGSLVRGNYENKIDLAMTVFGLEPNISVNLIDNLHFQLGLGLNFTASHRYEKSDLVLDPSGATFFNDPTIKDPTIRNESAGRFDNVPAVMLSANFGIYYDAALNANRTVFFSPGVYYHVGMTNFIENVDWKMNQLQVSLALKFSFGESVVKSYQTSQRDVIDTIKLYNKQLTNNEVRLGKVEVIQSKSEENNVITNHIINRRTDTLLIARQYILNGDIQVFGVDTEGNPVRKPQFLSEQFIANRNQPMLNYIFFDSLSYEIPERYNKLNIADAKVFNIESLYKKSNIETYYNILNILGYRLASNPKETITLKGCNSHIGGEKWNVILSRNRANAVANYLSAVWGIEKSRMKIEEQCLPDNYSYPSNQFEKAQENRRVEIYSNNYDLLAPIFVNDTAIVNQPPKAKFVINAVSEAGIANWDVNVINHTEAGSRNMVRKGDGNPPEEIEISLEDIVDQDFNPSNKLSYSLDMRDNNNAKFVGREKLFEVEKLSIQKKRIEKIGDMEIERFSLILFDFTSDVLSPTNLRTIEKVKSKITPNSNIKIIGYTDQAGDEKDNKLLSLKRAEAAYKALGRKDAIVDGKGESIVLYDNSLPEGRIYSRTVEIVVETPVNK